MNSLINNSAITENTSLTKQSEVLCQQLSVQRKLIKLQIDPDFDRVITGYPRSMTMRFLTQRPALVAGVMTEVATLMLGGRLLKSVVAALSVARIVSSAAAKHKNRLPAP